MARLILEPLPRDTFPGEVLRFVASHGQLDGKRIGKISLLGRQALVEVPDEATGKLLRVLDGADYRGKPIRVRLERSGVAQSGHFQHLSKLLDLEAIAEREQLRREAQSDILCEGKSLRGLHIVEEDAGLGGRWILRYASKFKTQLPPNRLQPGSPVVVSEKSHRRGVSLRGIVCDRTESSISVAFEQEPAEWSEETEWRLDLSPDEISRQRQLAALMRAETAHHDRLTELRAVLLGERQPSFQELEAASSPLNDSQKEAVRFALGANDLAIIHGPPGTGKTTTVVEFIRQAVLRGEKVLACAPSNAAVDNLLEKLMNVGLEAVRIGHPARVQENLRSRALDILVQSHPDARQARKMIREAGALFRQADSWTRSKPLPGEKQAKRQEARDLMREARHLEQLATERILDETRVVCSTLTGVDSETLGQRLFNWVVIDEACQATEPACWVPIIRGEKLLLAGDPCQLPATVLSDAASEQGLSISLMERQMALHGPKVSRLLQVQYRMNEQIMGFSNAEFYEGLLQADASVSQHTLKYVEGVKTIPLTEQAVTFIDTAGAGYDEELEEDTGSRVNPSEAGLVQRTVLRLLAAGVNANNIGVITPYSGQVRKLRELLKGISCEIDSVDGFQGREKEVIVYSLVRSNPEGVIGFLEDVRRSNVALTRARRKLIVIGDSATLAHHEFYQRLIGYFEGIAAYTSVWEEQE